MVSITGSSLLIYILKNNMRNNFKITVTLDSYLKYSKK